MTIKTKAAILYEQGLEKPYSKSLPLKVEEVNLDPPGKGEVLIKMVAAGLCHSDLSTIDGIRPRPLPMAIGHECSGKVLELGPGVNNLAVGDHVVLTFVPSCGHCFPCMEGRPALCEPGNQANADATLFSGERRLHLASKKINHHVGISAFSEYAVVSSFSCVKIDKDLDLIEAALFGCAVLTGVGAVVNTAKVQAGQTVAVIGLGGVGMCSLLGAIASGAREVIAIDLDQRKLDIAKKLGASNLVNAGDPNAIEKVKSITKGGVDFAFEMAGVIKAMELSYRVTKRGGTTVTASLPHPKDNWPLQQVSLVAEERTVKGSYMGSCIPIRDIPSYTGLFKAGKLPVNKLLSKKMRLEDINSGFDRLDSGESMRDLIVFDI